MDHLYTDVIYSLRIHSNSHKNDFSVFNHMGWWHFGQDLVLPNISIRSSDDSDFREESYLYLDILEGRYVVILF